MAGNPQWGMGALAQVALVGAVVGWLRIRSQVYYSTRWCGTHATSTALGQSSYQDFRQEVALSQQFHQLFGVLVTILALSLALAGVRLVAAHGRQRVAEPQRHSH